MGGKATQHDDSDGASGLSKLDVVKHAARSIVGALSEHNRLAIVVFSDNARVVLPLTYMTKENKDSASQKIDDLLPLCSTNLYDSVVQGVKAGTNWVSGAAGYSAQLVAGQFEGTKEYKKPIGFVAQQMSAPQTLLSSRKRSRNIVAPSAVVSPQYHGSDSGGGNEPLPKHQLCYQNVISSGSASPHHQNGGTNGSQTNALPVAVPLATSSDEFDVSKKRGLRKHSIYQHWWNAPLSQKVAVVVAVVCVLWFAVRRVRLIYRIFQGEQLPPPQTLDFLVTNPRKMPLPHRLEKKKAK